MSKVYVVQENNRMSYEDAERFGEVVFMTAQEYKPMKNSLQNDIILQDIADAMEDFDVSEDYLILTGNPMVIGFVMHLALMNTNKVNCLQWDRIYNRYREVEFDVGGVL